MNRGKDCSHSDCLPWCRVRTTYLTWVQLLQLAEGLCSQKEEEHWDGIEPASASTTALSLQLGFRKREIPTDLDRLG